MLHVENDNKTLFTAPVLLLLLKCSYVCHDSLRRLCYLFELLEVITIPSSKQYMDYQYI